MSGLCPSTPPSREDCRGDTAGGQDWFDYWNCSACYNTYFNFIYTSSDNQQWNQTNWTASQSDFVQIFNKYFSEGFQITIPGAQGYNNFQETLNSVCLQLPGVCNTALTAFCKGETTNPPCPNCNCGPACATREGIGNNAGLVNFCGCYAPLPTVPQSASVIEASPQCDPLCTRINTIKLSNSPPNGNNSSCNNNTCVIDNVSIQAASSTVGGTVNFNQICNQCTTGPCTCIISGVDLSETGNDVPQLQAQFNQYCGTNSQCLQIEPNGVDVPVNCQQALTSAVTSSNGTSIIGWIWIVVVVIFIIIIVVLVILSTRNSSSPPNPSSNKINSDPIP